MSSYVPADCLAFIESNNIADLADHVSATDAWKSLAGPIGAKDRLVPNRWLLRLARWTGIGSADAIVFARSQVGIIFTEPQTTQTGDVLTVKPAAALIIETHTTKTRMRPAMERAVSGFADRIIGPTTRQESETNGAEIIQWTSADRSRHLLMAFVGTAVIISNDESLLLRCVNVRGGAARSLADDPQLPLLRQRVKAERASIDGFVTKSGIKPLMQAWILSQAGGSEDSLTVARLFSDTFGSLIDGLGWASSFTDGATEDHCFLSLSTGVADQLHSNISPDAKWDQLLNFVPADVFSVSSYRFRDVDGFWRDLNRSVSSHSDALAAIASRPLLRGLVRAYGIEDADRFARAIGPQFVTVRFDRVSRSVLIAEAVDYSILRKLAEQRLGINPKSERIGDNELLLASNDDWGIAFAGNYFFSGPAQLIRRCLQAPQSQTFLSVDQVKRARQLIDVSLPLNFTKLTDDRHAAISFVELFSQSERPVFSSHAESVTTAARALPFAVSVALFKDDGIDWTSRSSFGLSGSLFVYLAPEKGP
jgi:hypothetical protein